MKKSIISPGLISLLLLMLSSTGDTLRTRGICSWVYRGNSKCLRSNFLCSNGKCIDRMLRCNGRDDCGDYSDESQCRDSNCEYKLEMVRCGPYESECVPRDWFCDGIKDCQSGGDERDCDRIQGTAYAIKLRALQWMGNLRQSQYSTEMWGSFVDKSAVAFYLANNTWTTRSDERRIEMAYEVSIQLLSRLSKMKLRDIPSSDLASYVHALLVSCLDPRKFHGFNIVEELRTRVDSQNYTNPYVLLSLCNAGDSITELDKMKLIDVFWAKHKTFWTDIQAFAVMALACASKQNGNGIDSETLHELALELKKHQYGNGTVENLQTTALVMQALLSAETDEDPENFDEEQALQHIYAMQKSDGSFGNLEDTYYILPVLNCKSLVNISTDHCKSYRKDEISAFEDLANRSGPKKRIRYSLWIGDNKHLETNLAMKVPANMSFYGIMEMAADIDSRYRFEYVVKNNKPYVNVLSGLKDNPEKGKFWFLYTVVKGEPSPSQESPADVIPKENEHFVIWYRSGSWID